MRDRPLACSDERGPEGRCLLTNYSRFVGLWDGETALVHGGGADLEIQQLYAQWETLQLQDDILYRNFLNTDGQVCWKQLLVPRSLTATLLQHSHGGPTAGHMGVRKTRNMVMKMAYWRGWRAGVALFCRRYIQCNRYRWGPGTRQGELQQAIARRPFKKIHVDLTDPQVRSKNGFVYILTAIDYFTK